MDKENYISANIESWNEAADVHQKINSGLHEEVNEPLYNNLGDSVVKALKELGIEGKTCVQICCNNGIDIISVKKLGAGYCLGIDGAEKFVDQARQLGKSANVTDLEFVTSKIDEISNEYNQQFDFALVTVGVLNWMPDLSEFFSRVSKLIKDGGHFIVEDMHPVLGMYEEGKPSYIEYSYFNKTPIADEQGLDYFSGKKYKAKPNYWFQHTLSDILAAAIDADLVLQKFEETPEDISLFCSDLEEAACNPPLGFMAQWHNGRKAQNNRSLKCVPYERPRGHAGTGILDNPIVKPQPLIAVKDVEASSRWYQHVLHCESGHGGKDYEQLMDSGNLILQLHRWDAHEHRYLGDAEITPYGNGVVLWFQTDDYDAALDRIQWFDIKVLEQSHLNTNANHRECWLQDPDGYVVVLASAYGDIGDDS